MRVPVSIATDITFGPTPLHITYPPHVDVWEASAPMYHHPGRGLRHAITWNVRHKNKGIVLDGHDLGPMLPHMPFDFIYHKLKSSRKVNYVASTVRMAGKSTACVDDADYLMITCGDPISFPSGFNATGCNNTVIVGMTGVDELRGTLNWMAGFAVDAIAFITMGGGSRGKVAAGILGFDEDKAQNTAIASLVTSTAVSWATGWQEPIEIKTETGTGYAGASGGISYNPSTGRVEAASEQRTPFKSSKQNWGTVL